MSKVSSAECGIQSSEIEFWNDIPVLYVQYEIASVLTYRL